jgi:hypothetical protein
MNDRAAARANFELPGERMIRVAVGYAPDAAEQLGADEVVRAPATPALAAAASATLQAARRAQRRSAKIGATPIVASAVGSGTGIIVNACVSAPIIPVPTITPPTRRSSITSWTDAAGTAAILPVCGSRSSTLRFPPPSW